MKTLSFILCFLFLVACGKNNTSGSKPAVDTFTENFNTELEIQDAQYVGRSLRVTTNSGAFNIHAPNSYFKWKKNIIAVISQDGSSGITIYNALGRKLLTTPVSAAVAELHVEDDLAVVTLRNMQGRTTLYAVNASGRKLINGLTGRDMHVKTGAKLLTVTYFSDRPTAYAVRSNGEVLVKNTRGYADASFSISTYVVVFRHRGGIEQYTR